MNNFIDVPYELLKKAVEKIEEKKGTCKYLPCARFEWDKAQIFATRDPIYRVKNSDGASIKQTYLVCDDEKMGGKSTGTAAETCKNCIYQSCPHSKTEVVKCEYYPDKCEKEVHRKCLKCGLLVDIQEEQDKAFDDLKNLSVEMDKLRKERK